MSELDDLLDAEARRHHDGHGSRRSPREPDELVSDVGELELKVTRVTPDEVTG